MKNLDILILILTSTLFSKPTKSLETKVRLSFYKDDGETELKNNNAFPDRLIVYLSFAGGNISLKLLRNIHLFSKDYKVVVPKASKISETKINEADLLCYYHGHVINSDGNDDVANVALSLCDGLRGSFAMNKSWYEIRPENIQANKWNYAYLKREENNMNYSCGFESNRKMPNNPNRKRKRSAVIMDRRMKIVEIFVGIDASVITAMEGNVSAANQRCIDIINLANLFFQGLDMYLVLVGTRTLEDAVPEGASSHEYGTNWLNYRMKLLPELPKHDLGLLLTKKTFGTVIGTALENMMCKLSLSIAFIADVEPMTVASATLAHEIGHSFGALHDEDYKICKCQKQACVLETRIQNVPDFGWSDCSISVIVAFYETGTDICLYNPVQLIGDSVCGDGIISGRERCDCGRLPSHLCNKECCDEGACMIIPGKGCSQGSCCDIKHCTIKKSGAICRSSKEECDGEEKCNGTSAECPEDRFSMNGALCSGDNYCYEGTCVSKDKACSKLYGTKVKASPILCYDYNKEGTGVFNCGYDPGNFSKVVPCSEENKMCGALHCDANEDITHAMFKKYKQISTYTSSEFSCTVVNFDVFLGVNNLGYVPDGAKCGETKLCLNRSCIERSDFIVKTNTGREPISGIFQIKYWQHVQTFSIILVLVTD